MNSFTTAVKNGFKRTFYFKGCATRAEYWWWQLFRILIHIPYPIMVFYGNSFVDETIMPYISIAYVIIDLLLFFPSLSLLVRRVHDVGHSWTVVLWGFIPIIGSVILLVITLWEGEYYNNHPLPSQKGDLA